MGSAGFHNVLLAGVDKDVLYSTEMEGSHSGLVRPPAKRLGEEIPLMGSNPIPSADYGYLHINPGGFPD